MRDKSKDKKDKPEFGGATSLEALARWDTVKLGTRSKYSKRRSAGGSNPVSGLYSRKGKVNAFPVSGGRVESNRSKH